MTVIIGGPMLHGDRIYMERGVLMIEDDDHNIRGFYIDPETMIALGLDLIKEGHKAMSAEIERQEALLDYYRGESNKEEADE